MEIEIILAVTGAVLLLAGLAGCVIPVLPGVPLAWAGLFAAHFSQYIQISVPALIVTGIFTVIITVLDFVLQPALTKKWGGSKNAVMGATIGLIAALFLGPLFILIAPFIGAFVGEMITDSSDTGKALHAAFGSFIGFLLGTGLKMICVIAFIWVYIFNLVKAA
jgi:uncharacterized protein YqgC (DUF456 family)